MFDVCLCQREPVNDAPESSQLKETVVEIGRKNNNRKQDAAAIGRGKAGPGRPRGAPNKVTRAMKEIAAEHGESAIAVLANVMNDESQPGAVRVTAADKLLDRGYGRPAQAVEVEALQGAFPDTATLDAIYAEGMAKMEANRLAMIGRGDRVRRGML